MIVRELVDELNRMIREDPDIADYAVVDADGETIDVVRPDEAYREIALEF